MNENLEPKINVGKLSIWYYCPKCNTFQYPEEGDLDSNNIAHCKYCNQAIDYSRYVKKDIDTDCAKWYRQKNDKSEKEELVCKICGNTHKLCTRSRSYENQFELLMCEAKNENGFHEVIYRLKSIKENVINSIYINKRNQCILEYYFSDKEHVHVGDSMIYKTIENTGLFEFNRLYDMNFNVTEISEVQENLYLAKLELLNNVCPITELFRASQLLGKEPKFIKGGIRYE